MTTLTAYHRPESVAEALQLLNRPVTPTILLAGGTALIGRLPEDVTDIVDLQAVGLREVTHGPQGQMTSGAMVTLQTLVADQAAPDIVRRMAHRAGPNTLRNAGTLGGLVARAEPDSELLAALLVLEATVTVATLQQTSTQPLAAFLSDVAGALKGGIITAIALQKPAFAAHARVARTPQDQPIVAAVAAQSPSGTIRLALCGVAETVVVVDPNALERLSPPGDFRGSTAYRKEMATVLAQRVLADLARQTGATGS